MPQTPCCSRLAFHWLCPILSGAIAVVLPVAAWGQIVPDTTLSGESSVVLPGGSIEGGAVRGSNLFHSFETFSIGAGQQVYFANPAGIENILGRVTGNRLSQIDGTLGVVGSANLFLLNPNGFALGPNAQLDLRGSFTASTANSLTFADGSFWRVSDLQPASLLSLSVPLGVQVGDRPQGNLSNQGSLSLGPGQSLTFLGNSVTHTGAIAASGGTIRLLGDRVSLLDQASLDVSSPNGGGTVLVGGDYQGRATVPVAQVTTVGPDTTIRADALSSGNGGEIIVWAAETANIHGILTARGGAIAGNGGLIETSGRQTLNLTATVEAGAPGGVGNVGGLWLIDPENVFITASGGGPIGSSDVDVAEINNALNSGTSVTITTDSVGTGLIFQASDAAILKTAGGAATLTLATDGSIFLEAGIITSGALTVVLQGNSIDVLNSISSANIQMQANFINIGSSLSSSGGNVSLQGGDISIGTGDPGLVSASALTVNANRLSIFNDSFLFGIDSLSITADVIQSVDATPGSSAFTSDNINADIIAGGTFSLTANEIRNFLTEQPGDFSTLRGNISNDISPFIGSSESPSGSEAPSSIARSILSSSSELIEFEDDEFEDDEFEDDEFEDEFVSFSDRRSEALASFNLTDCRQSNFTLSGRGGLPTSPDDLLSNSAPAIPWVNYSAESGTAEVLPPTAAVNLTEARGWTTDAAGNVFFEADAAATATPAFAFASGLCGGQNRPN